MRKQTKFLSFLQERGITFGQLSERLNREYTPQTLYQYASERRVPNKSDKKKIADALGVLVNDLF